MLLKRKGVSKELWRKTESDVRSLKSSRTVMRDGENSPKAGTARFFADAQGDSVTGNGGAGEKRPTSEDNPPCDTLSHPGYRQFMVRG
jgi:hypothetical protein